MENLSTRKMHFFTAQIAQHVAKVRPKVRMNEYLVNAGLSQLNSVTGRFDALTNFSRCSPICLHTPGMSRGPPDVRTLSMRTSVVPASFTTLRRFQMIFCIILRTISAGLFAVKTAIAWLMTFCGKMLREMSGSSSLTPARARFNLRCFMTASTEDSEMSISRPIRRKLSNFILTMYSSLISRILLLRFFTIV